MFRRYFPRIKLLLIISALSVLAGCSLWTNFTTYFNLYYNTSTLFEEAEQEIYSQKRDLFSTEPLVVSGAVNTKLVKVIEKSSKILQFYSNSSYVDDALMMLGKSFFYQKNYQKSKRKFEELLATNPDDNMRLAADLWIAKCNMNLKEFVSGLSLLERVRTEAIQKNDRAIIRESFVEEIIYRISREDYSQAIQLAEQMIPYSNSVTNARIYFELGKLYTLIGDTESAISSFANVFEYSPDFDLEIAASISYAKALRDADRDEEALDFFKSIRRQDKFIEKYNEIDLETAITLEKLNRFEQALEQFTIIDTTYKGTPFSAASSYYKGRIYEYELLNYDSAAFYYQKASTSNPPKDYAQSVKEKNLIFTKYFNLRKQIDNFNRQLYYQENPEIFIKDSIDYVQDSLQILSDYLAQKEMQDIWSKVFQPDSNAIKDSLLALDSLRIQDSIKVRDSLMTAFEQGLFLDTNEVNLELTKYLTEKAKLDSLKQKETKGQTLPQSIAGVNLDTVKFKRNPPRLPTIPVDSVKQILSKAQLELGNLFLAEINVPDSAYYLYTDNIDRFSETENYANTLYALGSYYLTVDNKAKADSLFHYIYDNYKEESVVNAAANKLNLPLIDLEYDPAKTLYASAESKMLSGDYENAVKEFWNIYKLYPESPVAPQALYAGGWVLEKDLNLLDSAAVIYDTLSVKYSASVYSREITKKLGFYKQELYRRQKEKEDAEQLASKEKELSTNKLVNGSENKTQDSVKQKFSDQTPDLESIIKSEMERKPEQVATGTDTPDSRQPKVKLEALWNPRKPR